MINHGRIRPGATLYFFFDTFTGSTGAPCTITNFAVGDIQIYKDGSTTQRASTAGFTLLDTDGVDFDSITGIQGFSVDLSDNTTAGFYACGSRYNVVVSVITVDSQTMSFNAGWFVIGHEGAMRDTTIATLSSQTSFTLTAGPTNDNAFKAARVIIQSLTGANMATGIISAYTGSTKTVTLAVDPGAYTMAAGDNISILPPDFADVRFVGGTTQTARDLGASVLLSNGTGTGQVALTSGSVKVSGYDSGQAPLQPTTAGRTLDVTSTGEAGIDWANIGSPTTTVSLPNTSIAGASAPTAAQVADAVWDELAADHVIAGSLGLLPQTIAGYLDTEIAAIKAKTDNLPADPADASDISSRFDDIDDALTGLSSDSSVTVNHSTPYSMSSEAYPELTVDILIGTIQTLRLYLRDANGDSINLGTATVAVACINQAGTTISSVSATIISSADGLVSVVTPTAWTDTAGRYKLFATVTGSDILVIGPLPLKVSPL